MDGVRSYGELMLQRSATAVLGGGGGGFFRGTYPRQPPRLDARTPRAAHAVLAQYSHSIRTVFTQYSHSIHYSIHYSIHLQKPTFSRPARLERIIPDRK